MAFNVLFRCVKQAAAFQTDECRIHFLTTCHTDTSQPELPERLPTIFTFPSAFNSVSRGRVKFGLFSESFPSCTSCWPISSAVIPAGLPCSRISKIMALRFLRFGLIFSYASRRFLISILIWIASLCNLPVLEDSAVFRLRSQNEHSQGRLLSS